jgi:hypothetical protein
MSGDFLNCFRPVRLRFCEEVMIVSNHFLFYISCVVRVRPCASSNFMIMLICLCLDHFSVEEFCVFFPFLQPLYPIFDAKVFPLEHFGLPAVV